MNRLNARHLLFPLALLAAAVLLWPSWQNWRQAVARETLLKEQYRTLRRQTAALPALPDLQAETERIRSLLAAESDNWPHTAAQYRLSLLQQSSRTLPPGGGLFEVHEHRLSFGGAYPDLYRLLHGFAYQTPLSVPQSWHIRPSENGAQLDIVLHRFRLPPQEGAP